MGFFLYQYANFRMLQPCYKFFYVFYWPFRLWISSDGYRLGCAYIAISGENVKSLVKPEVRERFEQEEHILFSPTDTEEHRRHDKRTPGLFKVEWEGGGIITLCSKTWYGWKNSPGTKDKFSCKSVNKRNNDITREKCERVLTKGAAVAAKNRGFRAKNTTKYLVTFYLAYITIPNYDRVTRI